MKTTSNNTMTETNTTYRWVNDHQACKGETFPTKCAAIVATMNECYISFERLEDVGEVTNVFNIENGELIGKVWRVKTRPCSVCGLSPVVVDHNAHWIPRYCSESCRMTWLEGEEKYLASLPQWRLDTGTDGYDETLVGHREDVIIDILHHHSLETWPEHWTLEKI